MVVLLKIPPTIFFPDCVYETKVGVRTEHQKDSTFLILQIQQPNLDQNTCVVFYGVLNHLFPYVVSTQHHGWWESIFPALESPETQEH